MEVVLSSPVTLIPGPPGCSSPWIVRFLETKGRTRFLHPLIDDERPFPNIPDQYLSLHKDFHPHYLGLCYHIAEVDSKDCSRPHIKHDKVLVFDLNICHSFPCLVKDCSMLVLSVGGQLTGFWSRVQFDVSYESVDKFDDILCFMDSVYALDRLGKLYQISADTFRVEKVIIDEPIVEEVSTIHGCRKRLVGSSLDESLYLVVRDDFEDVLRVYKMGWKWIQIDSFVDDDQILFLSRVDAFFAAASEFSVCKLNNCIVFYDAFPMYFQMSKRFNKKVKMENEIQVFWLGENSCNFKPISSYPDFPAANFFSPPEWVVKACNSYYHSQFKREIKEEVLMEHDISCREGASFQEHVSAPIFGLNSEKQTAKTPSTPAAPASHYTVYDNQVEDGPDHKKHEKKVFDASSAPVVLFQGVDVRSNLLSTLQSIWNKHGNLLGKNTVRGRKYLACALESLAEMVISLRNTSVRTLTKSQADELGSNLFDLERVGLKVDWLAPAVKKAVEAQKNMGLIKAIEDLNMTKAEVDEEEREFLARTAKRKLEIEDKISGLAAKLPFQGAINLDDRLGKELYNPSFNLELCNVEL